jgi:hypothetical protein
VEQEQEEEVSGRLLAAVSLLETAFLGGLPPAVDYYY